MAKCLFLVVVGLMLVLGPHALALLRIRDDHPAIWDELAGSTGSIWACIRNYDTSWRTSIWLWTGKWRTTGDRMLMALGVLNLVGAISGCAVLLYAELKLDCTGGK